MNPLARKLARAAILGAYGVYVQRLTVEPHGDEVHHATTGDGWRIALTRYRGHGRYRHPLILCHGLGASRVGFDLAPEVSLARHLAGEGFDVWCLELRGHGLSDRPSLLGPKSYGWAFDDYLHHDLPAALERVLAETGSERAHWLGHSMGGLLAYSYLAISRAPLLKSVITVGSSLDYSGSESDFGALLGLRSVGRYLPAIPFGPLARATSPLAARSANRLEEFNTWHSNVEPRLVRRLNASAFHPISTPVLLQLATALEPGGLRSEDGSLRYLDELPRAEVPVLALAGDMDRQCSPRAVQVTADALPNGDLKVFGKAHGQPDHYGHFDLLIGRRVQRETWPVIREFFAAND